jgi:hypothetical protein
MEAFMLTNRIMGAITFRKEVYAEVEKDTSFTQTAWLIVVIVSLLNQIGSKAGLISSGFGSWLIGVIVGTIFMVGGFAVAAFIISYVGKALFKADVSFEEMVRTLGLAFVWNAVGLLGFLGGIIPFLACLLAPVTIIAALAGLVAWFFAAKEALDLEWGQTIITVIIGFVVQIIIGLIGGAILGLFGIAVAGAAGILQNVQP